MRTRTIFSCCLIALALRAAKCDNDFYTAGVVEFRPIVQGMTSGEMLAEHLDAYLAIIYSTEAAATDILVFPEATLNSVLRPTFVPSPNELVAPCDVGSSAFYADFLVQLSCAAREVRKYIVINLTEEEKCPASAEDTRPCAANGLNVYNTNVVFDRVGRVISRYRKVHTYKEAKNTTFEPEFGIFETDFGVRFGHFICFDINFYTPAEELVQRFGVRDFIFTSWFYSELPFLTAVQLQQSWAFGNDVNLLAAGASYPQAGTTGTGIYAGSAGQLVTRMVGNEEGGVRELLVARVPKNGSKLISRSEAIIVNKNISSNDNNISSNINLPLMRDPQIENFNSTLLDFSVEQQQQQVNKSLCDGDHCCRFELLVQANGSGEVANGFHYRFGVFNGERTYEEEEISNLKICALYVCLNASVSSCALPTPSTLFDSDATPFNFQALRISGAFPRAEKLLLMPNSLLGSSLQPLPGAAVHWHVNSSADIHDVVMELRDVNFKDLLTFAIYANYYDKSAAMPSINNTNNDSNSAGNGAANNINNNKSSHFTSIRIAIMAICLLCALLLLDEQCCF